MASKTPTTTSPTTYASILDKPAGEFERPRAFPIGSYLSKITKFTFGEWPVNEQNPTKRPFVRFLYAPLQAGEDVDPVDFNHPTVQARMGKEVFRKEFTLTEEDMYRLVDHAVKHCGMDEEEVNSKSPKQLIAELVGKMVVVINAHRPDKSDSSIIYNDVTGFAKPE